MASKQKQKGSRWEREFCKKINGTMIPLSGALQGFPGDVRGPNGWVWECKHYKQGFVTLYKLLENRYALAIKIDYKEPLIVMRLSTYLEGVYGWVWECKHYKSGFVTLYKLLDNRDALAIKIDYKEPLIVMRLSTYLEGVHRGK